MHAKIKKKKAFRAYLCGAPSCCPRNNLASLTASCPIAFDSSLIVCCLLAVRLAHTQTVRDARNTYQNLIHSQIIPAVGRRSASIRSSPRITASNSAVGSISVKVVNHLSVKLVGSLGLGTSSVTSTTSTTTTATFATASACTVCYGLGYRDWLGLVLGLSASYQYMVS